MTHTPAPWQFWEGQSAVGKEFESGAKRLIADCAFGGVPVSECEANARLIAAAPELLHALKEVEQMFMPMYRLQSVKAAIAKAEGREP